MKGMTFMTKNNINELIFDNNDKSSFVNALLPIVKDNIKAIIYCNAIFIFFIFSSFSNFPI